jgi:dihydroxy-acid dehydratase
LDVPEDELHNRRVAQEKRDRPYTPVDRDRPVSAALRAYASMATSASDGAYRRVPE